MSDSENPLQKLPPQNIEAEQMVLGAIIINSEALAEVRAELRDVDFYKETHRKIYATMLTMNERDENIDLVTLLDYLTRSKINLESVGGASYLAYLVSLVPTAANIKNHVKIVINRAQLRAMIHACSEAMTQAHNLQYPDQIITDCITTLNDIRRHAGSPMVAQAEFVAEGFRSIEHRYEAAKQNSIIGIPTGFRDLDVVTSGWQPWFIILAGRPSMGKTALAEHFIKAAALHFLKQWEDIPEQERPPKPEKSVGFISIEMGKEPLALRALSRESRIPLSRLLAGTVHHTDWTHLSNAANRLHDLPINYQFATPQAEILGRKIDEFVQRYGAGLIVVDYLQLMEDHHKNGNREQEISGISRMIAHKKEYHNIPIIGLAQLSRKLEDRPDKRPIPSDLRESGSLEQDADVIIFAYREEVYKPCNCPQQGECLCGRRGKAQLLGRKGRNIGTWDIDLLWEKNITSFRDVEE
jgi:replicative DNA helicase